MENVGIVVPIYKEILNEYEKFSLIRLNEVLGKYPIIFVAPKSLRGAMYQNLIPQAKWQTFADAYFSGFSGYNKLLMSDDFYKVFSEYEKILICQPDVLVIEDKLQEFLTLPYDYFGAPIAIFRDDLYQLYGGNGGFSLRRIKACREALQLGKEEIVSWRNNEDEFFSYIGLKYPDKFRVAPVKIAAKFAFDRYGKFLYKYTGDRLPFAIHAWYSHNLESIAKLIKAKMNGSKMPVPTIWGSNGLGELLDFIKSNQPILFYGAGDWGKCFLQYCQYNGISINGFVVSDSQLLSETAYRGVPIWHIGEVPEGVESYGVVLTVGRMLRDEIGENLCAYGVDKVKELSEDICDEIGTFLLEQEDKTEQAIYFSDK